MDDLELIKQKLDIVELIQEYIPLKKAGVNYKTNCPFHQERSPSFMVSPERGIWHCFGCDRGGDIFKFVMEKEGLEFKEALELLAQKAGVVLRDKTERSKGDDRLFEANQKAHQFFHYFLINHPLGKKALNYLQKRGLTDETIDQFGIGYAPQNWEALTSFMRKRGFTNQELILSGLSVPSRTGCYDRFRGRIMFPLVDVRNRIIGFSGRIIDKGEPKYINSPQTPIFDKKRFLFGSHLSKGPIKEKGEVIVTEGEMDMMMSFQSGVKNVVASKGTAFTQEQIDLIKKYAEAISLCFDADIAGDAASRRGIEMADRAGLNIKVIQVEGAKDPAEICLDDVKKWEEAVKNATPIYDYYLQSVSKRFDLKLASSKKAIFTELLPIWKKITDPIVREHYIQKLAAMVEVKDELVREQLDNLRFTNQAPVVKAEPKSEDKKIPEQLIPQDRRTLLEEYLIALMLHLPLDHTFVPSFPETLLTQEELKETYVLLVIFLDSIAFSGKLFKIGEFIKTIPNELVEVVDRLYLMQINERLQTKAFWQKEVDTVVGELKKMLIKTSLEKLSLKIKNAQQFDKIETLGVLNKRFRDLSVKLKNL